MHKLEQHCRLLWKNQCLIPPESTRIGSLEVEPAPTGDSTCGLLSLVTNKAWKPLCQATQSQLRSYYWGSTSPQLEPWDIPHWHQWQNSEKEYPKRTTGWTGRAQVRRAWSQGSTPISPDAMALLCWSFLPTCGKCKDKGSTNLITLKKVILFSKTKWFCCFHLSFS